MLPKVLCLFLLPSSWHGSRSTHLTEAGAINYTLRSPVGVAGLISPWNLPSYLLSFKIAPAIAAGCTVVCKPSEMTSLTAHMLAKVMNEAGEYDSFVVDTNWGGGGGYKHFVFCCWCLTSHT